MHSVMNEQEMTDDEKMIKGMRDALNVIHDKALQLSLVEDLPREVGEGLDLIASLARYQFDVRSVPEIAEMNKAQAKA